MHAKEAPSPQWVKALPFAFIPQRKVIFCFNEFAEDVKTLKPQIYQLFNEMLLIRITRATSVDATATVTPDQNENDLIDSQVDVEMGHSDQAVSDVSFRDNHAEQQQQADSECRDHLPAPTYALTFDLSTAVLPCQCMMLIRSKQLYIF